MNTSADHRRMRLGLSTGEIFDGFHFGAPVDAVGEVVFNTAMSGYQESLSDPSYTGQILVQTMPMIGNTGMNNRDLESNALQVSGLIIHEHTEIPSNYRSDSTLDQRLADAGIPAIAGVDTRALTRILRTQGVVQGVMTTDESISDQDLISKAQSAGSMKGSSVAIETSRSNEEQWGTSSDQWAHLESDTDATPVVVIDCGIKDNILRCLIDVGCAPIVVPITTTTSRIKELLQQGASGIFLSNGPGDPESLTGLIDTVRELIEETSIPQRY